MAEEKSGLDKFRDLYLPTVRKYEKKLADSLSYFAGPELTKLGQGIFALRPFQGSDLPIYDSNKSFGKNMLDMATGTGILGLDFATLGTASAPQKMAIKAAQEAAESSTKTGVRTVDEIIEEGVTNKSSKVLPKQEKILLNLSDLGPSQVVKMTDKEIMDYMKDVKDIDKRVVVSAATLQRALKKFKENNNIVDSRQKGTSSTAVRNLDEVFSNSNFLNEIKDKSAVEIYEIAKKYGMDDSIKINNFYRLLDTRKIPYTRNVNSTQIIRDAIENLGTKEISYEDIFLNPNVKKLLDDKIITKGQVRTIIAREQKQGRIPELTITKAKTNLNVIEKLGIENKLENFLKNIKNKTGEIPDNKILVQEFPSLRDLPNETINRWRTSKGLMYDTSKKADQQYSKLIRDNPELRKSLEFISQSGDKTLPSNIPIKYLEGFYDVDKRIFNKQTTDVKRTKLVQAHAIGGGQVKNIPLKDIVAIGRKVDYIPDRFIEALEEPKFFLTKTGNDTHRVIEDNLVNDLVKKYKLLGYEHIDGVWKPTKKVNAKSVSKELKDLETKISKHKEGLKEIDAYTLFYNPVTDKLVSYGQDIDKIPGLSNLINQVKKGTKKLKGGGLVGISHLTRPLGNF